MEEKLLSSLAEQEEAADDGVEELEEIQEMQSVNEEPERSSFASVAEPEREILRYGFPVWAALLLLLL